MARDDYYKEAARILKEVWKKKRNVRTLVYSSELPYKSWLLKLCISVCAHRKSLRTVRKNMVRLSGDDFFHDQKELALAMLHDFYYHEYKKTPLFRMHILKHESLLNRLKEECGIGTKMGTDMHMRPTYVRVNALLTTLDEVCKEFEQFGWKQLATPSLLADFNELVNSLQDGQFCLDYHVENLLVLPAKYQSPIPGNNRLIMQDKSSCFAVLALQLQPGMHVLDACAAPGNKTSHIAALIKNKGRIMAVDCDETRYNTMVDYLTAVGVKHCKFMREDFLLLDPTETKFSKVTHILLDPPCSGSGMVKRMHSITDKKPVDKARLKKLSNFQAKLLKHALYFPALQRCVYSTCSVYEEENEMVVEEIARKLAGRYHLEKIFPEWEQRGLDTYECGEYCIRCDFENHSTNGFFVACFVRNADEWQ